MRLVRGNEVCEVLLEGLLVREGDSARKYVTIDHARRAYDKAVAARLAAGYVIAPDVHADLDARAVLGDELMDRGDPRGELIGLASNPEAFAAKLDKHHDALFGPLASAVRRPSRGERSKAPIEVVWKAGFADEVRGSITPDLYKQLRELPIAQTITKIVAGDPGVGGSYVPLTNAMLRYGVPPKLHALALGNNGAKLFGGDLCRLLQSIPELVELDLDLASGTFAPVTIPTLRRLVLHQIDPMPVFASTFASLAELELRAVPYGARFLEHLGRSAIVKTLDKLVVWRSNLEDPSLLALAMHARRYAHLTSIDLPGNRFSTKAYLEAREDLPMLTKPT